MQLYDCPEGIYGKKDLASMKTANNRFILLIISLMISLLLCGCFPAMHSFRSNDIPVLSQDELIRPYTKLGRIQVTREVFISDFLLNSDIKAWGLAAVRQEAEKMGADAIMLFEVTGRTTTNASVPATEYIATGFAIRFK